MKTVAITGGIGSGKSEVCRILAARGVPVYDCDSAAKRLYGTEPGLLDSIEEAFGCSVSFPDGRFDAGKLSSLVFSDAARLRTLESIVHPAVLRDFRRWKVMQESRADDGMFSESAFPGGTPFVVMESAIILEKPEFLALADKVVMVDAPLSVRLKRACERDDVSADKVIERMSYQRFDISRVDAVLKNDGTLESLEKKTVKLFANLF